MICFLILSNYTLVRGTTAFPCRRQLMTSTSLLVFHQDNRDYAPSLTPRAIKGLQLSRPRSRGPLCKSTNFTNPWTHVNIPLSYFCTTWDYLSSFFFFLFSYTFTMKRILTACIVSLLVGGTFVKADDGVAQPNDMYYHHHPSKAIAAAAKMANNNNQRMAAGGGDGGDGM